MNLKLVAFDLDGTLLTDNKLVGDIDYQTLIELGKREILRVAATGRNLFSIQRLLNANFPIDYAVFSSGAGIIDWHKKEVLLTNHLNENEINQAINVFMKNNLSFTVHLPIPKTHFMYLKLQDNNSVDLKNYTHFYKDYLNDLDLDHIPKEATQLIALINRKKEMFSILNKELYNLKVVLTTSPINNSSLWVEVFNKNVSKANGIEWICNKQNINIEETFSIGNDYNDLDMLKFTKQSFVVSNAKEELKKQFKLSHSNNKNGFTFALRQVVDI